MLSQRDHAKQETSNEARLEALMLGQRPQLIEATLLELDKTLSLAGYHGNLYGGRGVVARLNALVSEHVPGLRRELNGRASYTERDVLKLAKTMRGLK